MKNRLEMFLFISILLLAALLRFTGLNWDQHQHQHPDERFLTMVTDSIEWPSTFSQFLNTDTSPLNPHNKKFDFYVYGTFPVFFTKAIADTIGLGSYDGITLVGRVVSGVIDLGTLILIFFIGLHLKKSSTKFPRLPLLAMFFYAVMPLPIQLSHYYAVDTFLTFFITLTFFLCTTLVSQKTLTRKTYLYALLVGISFGLSIACKVTALLFTPVLGLMLLAAPFSMRKQDIPYLNKILFVCIWSVLILIAGYATTRLAYPYLFKDSTFISYTINPKILANWKELKSFDGADTWFPPGVQWINTKPYIFPLKNLIFWGIGLPIGMLFLSTFGYLSYLLGTNLNKAVVKNVSKNGSLILFLTTLWILLLFTYQGGQFSKNMRYFIVIYPFIALLTAYFSSLITNQRKYWVIGILCIISFLPGLAMMSIYTHPHTRTQASDWIYANIPAGAIMSGEHWDDYLPVNFPDRFASRYRQLEFPLYGADTQEKWINMDNKLRQVDYIIMSSNRLYGSISSVPKRYPITTKYYEKLFDGSLGFQLIVQFTSRPTIPFPGLQLCIDYPGERYGIVSKKVQQCTEKGIAFVDDYADESFTVYDHPKVVIFKKIKPVDYLTILTR